MKRARGSTRKVGAKRIVGTAVLAFSLIASGMLATTPAAAESTAAEDPQAAPDLGKDCSKTADQIRDGLIGMGGTDQVTTVRHRGDFNQTTPENSLKAFENSYTACRPGIETDVRKTKDGKFVMFHDVNIGKMLEPDYNPETNTGPNATLSSLTYAELQAKPLLDIERRVTDQKVPDLETFLRNYAETKGRSMINLEIKSDDDVMAVIKEFNEINLKISSVDLYKRTIFKFRMTAFPEEVDFRVAASAAKLDPDRMMVMPMMSAQIAEGLERQKPKKSPYDAVNSWSSAPAKDVPTVEVVMKDAQGYKRFNYDFLYYGETDSYLDMLPMTFPDSTTLANTREGTMAEMSELVKSKNKPLAQFVPIPDWAMWRSNVDWNRPLPNVVPGSPTITPREAYFNNNSKCCYALSDRLKSDGADREKADQRILLPFQEKIKATVLTADDTDSIDAYFKGKGKFLDLGDNTKNPNKPNPAMNSLIQPGARIPRSTVAQTANTITGTNQLINAEYRYCANNYNRRLETGNPVKSWKCDRSEGSNIWSFEQPDAEGYRKIGMNDSGFCLDGRGQLGQVQIYPCNVDSPNLEWKFRSDGSIVNRTTQGCLTLSGDQSGSPIETQSCNDSGRQQWLTDYSENTYGIVNSPTKMLMLDETQKCLSLNDSSGQADTKIWLDTCYGPRRQWSTWTNMVNGQGSYAPILQSDVKDASTYFYMCAAFGALRMNGDTCKDRGEKVYQWYFTPDRELVSISDGLCMGIGTGIYANLAMGYSCNGSTRWSWK